MSEAEKWAIGVSIAALFITFISDIIIPIRLSKKSKEIKEINNKVNDLIINNKVNYFSKNIQNGKFSIDKSITDFKIKKINTIMNFENLSINVDKSDNSTTIIDKKTIVNNYYNNNPQKIEESS